MRGFSKLVKLIRQADSILIIGHQNSDPDGLLSLRVLSFRPQSQSWNTIIIHFPRRRQQTFKANSHERAIGSRR